MSKSADFGWAVPKSRIFGWMVAGIVALVLGWGSIRMLIAGTGH